MSDITYLVPSRGRPENIERLAQQWPKVTKMAKLVVIVDADDEKVEEYPEGLGIIYEMNKDTAGLGSILNKYANKWANYSHAIGFMGDDHLPQTEGWDVILYEDLLELGSGIIYPNDLFQRHRLPTSVLMSSDIITTLGYMCPPGIRHLYLDDFWKELGTGIGRIYYDAGVVVEHRHPAADKAEWDDSYRQNNSTHRFQEDKGAYLKYKWGQLNKDVALLKDKLGIVND